MRTLTSHEALAEEQAVQCASRIHPHHPHRISGVKLLQGRPQVHVILAGDDAVNVPLLEVAQIIPGRGLGAQGHEVAPIGERAQVMPGAYAPAAVGDNQYRPWVARIYFRRDKGALGPPARARG